MYILYPYGVDYNSYTNETYQKIREASMKRVAIVGCGNIAQVHAWALSQIGDVRLVAVVDPLIHKAHELSLKYTNGTAKVYKSITDMLSKEKLDVLHICTPHYLHVPMAIEALKSRVAVFMEKPPAISQEEFNLLVETKNQVQGTIGFCFQNRYNDTTKALDKIVSSGNLGKVLGARAFVTWRRDREYYGDGWHGVLEKEGGGVLINQSIHTLDLMLRYLGTPTKIAASMSNHHLLGIINVEDTLEAWMEFEDGKRACFYASNAYVTDAPVILEIELEKGRVTLMDKVITVIEQGKEPKQLYFKEHSGIGKSYWGTSHLACIKDFYSHITYGTFYQNDIHGVANTLKTTMELYQYIREGEERERVWNK